MSRRDGKTVFRVLVAGLLVDQAAMGLPKALAAAGFVPAPLQPILPTAPLETAAAFAWSVLAGVLLAGLWQAAKVRIPALAARRFPSHANPRNPDAPASPITSLEHHYLNQLRDLTRAAVAINSGQNPDSILAALVKRAGEIVGAQWAAAQVQSDDRSNSPSNGASWSDRHEKISAPFQEPAQTLWRYRHLELGQGVRLLRREVKAAGICLPGVEPPNLMVAPLGRRDGRQIGFIQLSGKRDGEFTDEDEAILMQLAQIASVAIEKAQLYTEVAEKRVRLEELSARLLRVQEDELKAISRELHDNLGQVLTAIKMNLDILRTASFPPAIFQSRIEETIAMVKQVLHETRDLAQSLRPQLLDELGLVPALRWFLDDFRKRSGITVSLQATEPEQPPNPETAATIYRVVQEAITNIARHSEARNVFVELRCDAKRIFGSVDDDGRGFIFRAMDRSRINRGLGLLGMRERIELAGGAISIDSEPGAGTRISFSLPNRRHGNAREDDSHSIGR